MIISSQGYIFIQELKGDNYNSENVSSIIQSAGYKYHEHMFPFVEMIEKASFDSEKYLRDWSEAFHRKDIKIITSYFDMPNYLGYVEDSYDEVAKQLILISKYFPEMRIITTNPKPLPESIAKTQSQIETQTKDLKNFIDLANELGIKVSYHFHSPELINDAFELHYTMKNIDKQQLLLTFDVNWCLMGGQSICKILDLYQQRVEIVHLRSSINGVWEQVLDSGDEKLEEVITRCMNDNKEKIYTVELANGLNTHKSMDIKNRLIESRRKLEEWYGKFRCYQAL